MLGRDEQILIQQIIPTSRVKKVIEASFEEARRMGNKYVGTNLACLRHCGFVSIERRGREAVHRMALDGLDEILDRVAGAMSPISELLPTYTRIGPGWVSWKAADVRRLRLRIPSPCSSGPDRF